MGSIDIETNNIEILKNDFEFHGRIGCVFEQVWNYLSKINSKDDIYSIITFNNDVNVMIEMKPVYDVNYSKFFNYYPDGGTSFYNALKKVKDITKKSKDYHLSFIFLTDGDDDDKKKLYLEESKNLYNDYMNIYFGIQIQIPNPLNFYIIHIGEPESEKNLIEFKNSLNGEYLNAISKLDLKKSFKIVFKKVKSNQNEEEDDEDDEEFH